MRDDGVGKKKQRRCRLCRVKQELAEFKEFVRQDGAKRMSVCNGCLDKLRRQADVRWS